jgi:hypothetical protein
MSSQGPSGIHALFSFPYRPIRLPLMVDDNVACRPVARQRPQNMKLYNSSCYVMAATDAHAKMEDELEAVFCAVRAEAI